MDKPQNIRVPLDQIYFDTFQPVNRTLPLSQALPELIEELRGAIEPLASGRALSLKVPAGRFVDRETGSVWNLAGQSLSGTLSGAQLPPLSSCTSFRFAIVAPEPDIKLLRE